jgi:ABC-type transport system substrate-binding protein
VWINPWRDPFKVPSFDKPLDELMKENGFKVRMAIAKGIDRDRLIERAQFGRGVPAFGTINPAMGYYFDKNLGESSAQKYELDVARKLLAEAGFPNGEGMRPLKLLHTPALRREVQVIKDILKRNLNIDVLPDPKDFPVLIDEFWRMEWDLLRIGSGGDFDPDDGLVDWMQTASKFNGPKRDKSKMPFGYFSSKEADEMIDKQLKQGDPETRRRYVRAANKITSDKLACVFIYHPVDAQVRHKSVNFPKVSRIPGLVDLDRTSIS